MVNEARKFVGNKTKVMPDGKSIRFHGIDVAVFFKGFAMSDIKPDSWEKALGLATSIAGHMVVVDELALKLARERVLNGFSPLRSDLQHVVVPLTSARPAP